MMLKTKIIIFSTAAVIAIFSLMYVYYLNLTPDMVNDCKADSECVIVKSNVLCGGAAAISADNEGKWNLHLKLDMFVNKKNTYKIDCKMTPPLTDFDARCIENRCTAVQKI